MYRRLHNYGADLFENAEEGYHERRGRIKELKDLLGKLETMKAATLENRQSGEEEEENVT